LRESPLPLESEPLRAAFGGGENWRRCYRDFIEVADNVAAPQARPTP
jgi:hypothetical protein